MLNKHRWLMLAAIAAVSAAQPALAEQGPPAQSEISTKAIELPKTSAFVRQFVTDDRAPGIVVAVGTDGDAPTFVTEGVIADGAEQKATPDTLWRVYSMTKPITAMAAMTLIEDGKMSLDQPVSDFIPAFKDMQVLVKPGTDSMESRPARHPITIRNLLTHTAGLGYSIVTKGALLKAYEKNGILPATISRGYEQGVRASRPESLEEFANRLAKLPLIADPGSQWSYSIGLDVMGRVIEVASGMPFDRYVQTRILDPLKMQSTYWTVPGDQKQRLATNYIWMGDTRVPLDPGATSVFLDPPSFPYGGAGLVMSARDYDRFLHMLQNGGSLDGAQVMKPETVHLAMSNLLPNGVTYSNVDGATGGSAGPKMGFGAGGSVYLEDVPGGPGKGTYGWGGAAGTIAWVDPERHVRGTVMVNYIPADKWPLRREIVSRVYSDLGK